MKKFSITEKQILNLFKNQKKLKLGLDTYDVVNLGKPIPSDGKGEAKTDVYVELENAKGEKIELKISIKQKNADFLENKISLERAKSILGENAKNLIIESIKEIEDKFKSPLVYLQKSGKTEAGVLTIGWKFELMNKLSGAKSSKILLNYNQKLDIYSGSTLITEKKNCKLNEKIIPNSGVANFILEVDPNNLPRTAQEVCNLLESIEKYVNDKEIYFACKAINYRTSKDKWDGNRPLAVYVNWSLKNNIIYSEIITDNPLELKANEIGIKIKCILSKLDINKSNFKKIEDHISDKSIIFGSESNLV